MSKKKKIKDFWGSVAAEDQMEESELFDAMEESGEVNIFSLGKIPKHYTGLEAEITADINKVFGNKVIHEGDTVEVPEGAFDMEAKMSEDFVASLKREEEDDTDDSIDIDLSMIPDTTTNNVKKPVNNKSKNSNADKKQVINKENTVKEDTDEGLHLETVSSSPISNIRFKLRSNILSLTDNYVSLYYKLAKGEDSIRYVKPDVTYDDSVLREILYLIRYIVAFRHPTALYEFSEFEKLFDEVKGVFKDSNHESRYMFIDFDDYVAAYYFGSNSFIRQLDDLRVAKTNEELADIIMGIAVESLDFNMAFMREEFESYYNSKSNIVNKQALIDQLKKDIDPDDKILMLDVHSFNNLFDRSEVIMEKYLRDSVDHDSSEDDDNDLEDEIKKLLSDDDLDIEDDDDIDISDDDDADDESDEDDDDFDEEDDEEDLDDEEEEEDSDADSSDDTSSDIDDNMDIDSMIDEAVGEEDEPEPESKPIDKVALHNQNKSDSMVIEVTRKTHA